MSVHRYGKTKAGEKRLRVVILVNGKRYDRIVTGTKAEAKEFEARELTRLEIADPSHVRVVPTFSDYSVRYYTPDAKMHLKASTWVQQKSVLVTLLQEFGGCKLTQITKAGVDAFKQRRQADGLKVVSINNELRVLKRVLNHAAENQIPASSSKDIRYFKEPQVKKNKAWTKEEVDRLLAACTEVSPEIVPLVLFLVNTGARKGEALALKWEHIEPRSGLIHIWPSDEWQPKNNKPREIPISDALRPLLEGERRSATWVFPSSKGERYATWPKRQFDRARRAAGLKGGPHRLRHTYATQFIEGRDDMRLLAEVLGHSDAAVTRIYGHVSARHLERARNVVNIATPQAAG